LHLYIIKYPNKVIVNVAGLEHKVF
jgi:hypothetical protein